MSCCPFNRLLGMKTINSSNRKMITIGSNKEENLISVKSGTRKHYRAVCNLVGQLFLTQHKIERKKVEAIKRMQTQLKPNSQSVILVFLSFSLSVLTQPFQCILSATEFYKTLDFPKYIVFVALSAFQCPARLVICGHCSHSYRGHEYSLLLYKLSRQKAVLTGETYCSLLTHTDHPHACAIWKL